MKQEDRKLLFDDLCARLPYHPILNWKFLDNTSKDDELKDLSELNIWWITQSKDCEVKPYLRPMSSMTAEEEYEYHRYKDIDYLKICEMEHKEMLETTALCFSRAIDWLNAHHFDYRGLIPMGLALEASEDMYNI